MPLDGLSQAGRRRVWLVCAAVASTLVHGGVIWTLLPHGAARTTAEMPATIEVEMVNQPAQTQGTPAVQPTQPPPSPPAAPIAATAQKPPAPEAAPDPTGALSAPSPPATPQQAAPQAAAAPPPQPQQQAPPGPAAPPASVNLGNADEDKEALSVTGDNVVPPRPDARVQNRPPAYPVEAVRRHAEGLVRVRIHVTETGTPGYVDVIQSSGDASLDRSVREAVMLWQFEPARDHGTPIPFDTVMNFEFSMNRP